MNSSNLEDLFPRSNTFRIAVCLSGELRHWRTAVANIKQFFEFPESQRYINGNQNLPITTDYFIHTWDTNTWRYYKMEHVHFKIEPHSDKSDVYAAYNPKGMIQEPWEQPRFKRAWDSMFYSHARSVMLKREYELENNFQYDMVVKSRFDTVYNPRHKIPLDLMTTKMCYSPHVSLMPLEFNYNNFDDVVFYGDSPTMDLVADLYHTYKILHSPEKLQKGLETNDVDPSMYYGPGCLLYNHMIRLGIHPERHHTFDYAIVRSTAAELNLDGIKDYDEIRKKWFDWYI